MNKIILSASAALLCSVTATGALALDFDGYKDVCWRFSKLDETNPYPTDTISVKNGLQKVCKFNIIRRQLECEWKPVLDTPLSGHWVQSTAGRSVIVPLVGTMQWNSYPVTSGVDPSIVIDFHGSIQDLSFNSPFSYQCTLNGLINPETLDSPTSTGQAPFSTGYPGYIFAACPGYFPAVDGQYSPFTNPLFLKEVSCDAPPV